MKIEKELHKLFKGLRLYHLIIFIVINFLTFFGGHLYFKDTPIKKEGLTTLTINIPRYNSIGAGIANYLTILNSTRLFAEFDVIPKNKKYNKTCTLTHQNYDNHVFYYAQEKHIASFEKFIPIIIKIKHPNKELIKKCAETFIEISKKQFLLQKDKLIQNLNSKLLLEIEMNKLKNIAVFKILNEIKIATKDYGQTVVDTQDYLFETYLDYIKTTYLDQGKTLIKNNLESNKTLEIEYNITQTIVEIPNNYETKIVIINLVTSLLLIFAYLISFKRNK